MDSLIKAVHTYSLDHYLQVVEGFTLEDWDVDQTRAYRGHFAARTKSMREGLLPHIDRAFTNLRDLTAPILDDLYGKRWEIGRFVLSKAPPGGGIRLHRDQLDRDAYMRRLHIPITTNPGAVTMFPYKTDKKLFMPLGSVHEFNFREPHKTENTGPTDRIHLVFDVWAPHKNEWLSPDNHADVEKIDH